MVSLMEPLGYMYQFHICFLTLTDVTVIITPSTHLGSLEPVLHKPQPVSLTDDQKVIILRHCHSIGVPEALGQQVRLFCNRVITVQLALRQRLQQQQQQQQ
jgi:hypothetical protein